MIKKLLRATILSALLLAVSCSGKKEISAEHHEEHAEETATTDEWKAMDDFHMVMAESFHPYKDSANLQPAKELAAEMAQSAEAWANEPLPEKLDKPEVKQKIEALKSRTASFAELVQTANDEVVADSLNSLHDLFHSIQEEWYGAGHHH